MIGIHNSIGVRSRSSADLGLWDYGFLRIADSVQISGAHGLQDCGLLRRADEACSPPFSVGITRQTHSEHISNHCADHGLQEYVQQWVSVPRSLRLARGPLRPCAPRPRARRFAVPCVRCSLRIFPIQCRKSSYMPTILRTAMLGMGRPQYAASGQCPHE